MTDGYLRIEGVDLGERANLDPSELRGRVVSWRYRLRRLVAPFRQAPARVRHWWRKRTTPHAELRLPNGTTITMFNPKIVKVERERTSRPVWDEDGVMPLQVTMTRLTAESDDPTLSYL